MIQFHPMTGIKKEKKFSLCNKHGYIVSNLCSNQASYWLHPYFLLISDTCAEFGLIGWTRYMQQCIWCPWGRNWEDSCIALKKSVLTFWTRRCSVRFLAREVVILNRLDHPNVMKLNKILTSRLSCVIYLVFEYMEHDISGLLSCPDIKWVES